MRPPIQYARLQERFRRGSALIEFTLVGTFIFLPLLAGLASVGMNMVTAMQAANLNSSAGQMFSSGQWDAGQLQTMLPAMAGTLNSTSPGVGGVVILSEIQNTSNGYICTQLTPITIGNGGATGASKYCQAGAVNPPFNMVVGQTAFIAETYYINPNLAWVFARAGTSNGIYEVAVF